MGPAALSLSGFRRRICTACTPRDSDGVRRVRAERHFRVPVGRGADEDQMAAAGVRRLSVVSCDP